MKLHNNSRFDGGVVVLFPSANLLKVHRLIEVSSCTIGFTHFQENLASHVGYQRSHQPPGYALAAKLRTHGEVEQLVFPIGHIARDQKPRHATSGYFDAQVVLQISVCVPMRAFRAGSLNGFDF